MEKMPVAYLYENEAFGKELVLDCNGEYARRLLELGYTETPLFAAQVGTHPQGGDSLEAPAPLSDAVAEGHAPLPLSQSITPPEVGGELVERMARAICKASGAQWRTNEGMSKHAIEMLDQDALNNHWRHKARAAIAALSTPEVVDGNQVFRASAQEGTALSSQATEPQASPPCGLQSTDAWGNWRAEFTDTPYAEIGEGWVVDSPEGSICTLDGPVAEREAHAHLIAAAPEMLGALRELRRWKAFSHPDAAGAFTEANRIIAKAEAKS